MDIGPGPSRQPIPRDPNFPEGLRIAPSSKRRATDGSTPVRVAGAEQEEKATWDVDSQRDIEDFGIAGRIWEAAYLLVRYLTPPETSSSSSISCVLDPPPSLYDATSVDGVRILELGSGVGYVGLHLAQQLSKHLKASTLSPNEGEQRATLVLTDLENVVPLMRRNAELAGFSPGEGTRGSVDVLVRPLPWGDKAAASSILSELDERRRTASGDKGKARSSDSIGPLTHIIASDLVYFPELLAPLLRSLIDLTSPSSRSPSSTSAPRTDDGDKQETPAEAWIGPELIIAYKVRSLTKEQPFWNALGAWFEWDVVTCQYRRGDVGKGGVETGKDEAPPPPHRFGELQMDLEPLHLQGSVAAAGSSDEREAALDDYFVFVARRRADSLDCAAPGEDAKLMDGWRERVGGDRDATKVGEGQEAALHRATGTDAFENMLMGMMAL